MKKLASIVCCAACAFSLFMAGCSSTENTVTDKNTSNSNQTLASTPTKQGGTTRYDVPHGEVVLEGSTITVTLEGNPTTGYQWTAEVNGDNLKAVSDDFKTSSKYGNIAGVGGIYTFKFEGFGTGVGILKINYARSWEQTPSDEWVEITVATREGQISDTVAEGSDGSKSESHS